MPVNTTTFGQLPPKIPVAGDLFAIQGLDGLNYKVTGTELANFVGSIPINSLSLKKVTTPSDPPLEEGIAYLRTIDGTNNGWFIKIKKAGVITEVQIA